MEFLRSDFEYFIGVAEAGSLSRAAEKLQVRQSTLSKSMQRLEEGMHCSLLIRHSSGVRLTVQGQGLLGRLRGLRDEWERIEAETLASVSEVGGRVSFGAHSLVAVHGFEKFLPELMVRHPKLEARVAIQTSRELVEDLLDFRLDFGLVIDPPRHPDLVLVPLKQELVGYWRASSQTGAECDLRSGRAVVIFNPQLIGAQPLLDGLKSKGMKYSRIMSVEDYATCASLARAGAGVALIPQQAASGLVPADPKAPSRKAILHLVYRADTQRGATARAVIERVRNSFAEESRNLVDIGSGLE